MQSIIRFFSLWGNSKRLRNFFVPAPGTPSCPADKNKLSGMMASYCVPLLTKLGHSEDVLPPLRGQLGQWVSRSGALQIPEADLNGLDYWHGIAIHVPLLAKVVVAVHSITPSEACVERSFSQQGLLHSEVRASLSAESVKALMDGCVHEHSASV